jgi:hypothetical protein
MQARGAYLEPVGAVLAAREREGLQSRRLGSNGDWRRALDRSVMGHDWTTLAAIVAVAVYEFLYVCVYVYCL